MRRTGGPDKLAREPAATVADNTINGKELIRSFGTPSPRLEISRCILHDWTYLLNLVCDKLQVLIVIASSSSSRLHN